MPDSPTMARLKQAAARRRRAVEDEQAALLAAVEAGDNQSEIARVIGRSREHVRRVRLAAGHDANPSSATSRS